MTMMSWCRIQNSRSCCGGLLLAVAGRAAHRHRRRGMSGWTTSRSDDGSPSLVLPGKVSPQLDPSDIPSSVRLPSYASGGCAPAAVSAPEVKSADCVDRMRAACRLAREVLDATGRLARRPGCTTDRIDRAVAQMCFSRGAYPSPLNYRGFPKSVCTSVNNVACHGIPDDRPLQSGDVVNVDVTVFLDGVHGDCSETFAVGTLDPADEVDVRAFRLLAAARACLDGAVAICGPGREFREIGSLIQKMAREEYQFRCQLAPLR